VAFAGFPTTERFEGAVWATAPIASDISQLESVVGGQRPWKGHMFDLVGLQASHVETIANGINRQSPWGMLDAGEPFFFNGRNQSSIHEERSGWIVTKGAAQSQDNHGLPSRPWSGSIFSRS